MDGFEHQKLEIIALKDSPTKAKRLAALVGELRFVNPEEARSLADECLTITDKFELSNIKIDVLNYIAVTYCVQSHFNAGQLYFKQALTLAKEIKDEYAELRILTNIGILYFNQAKYTDSLEIHLKAITLAKALDKQVSLANNQVSIANIYFTNGDAEKALKLYEKVLEASKKLKQYDQFGYVYFNIGTIYHDQKKYKEAKLYYEKSIPFMDKVGNSYNLCIVYNGLAAIYADLKKYDLVVSFFKRALDISRNQKIIKEVCHTLTESLNFLLELQDVKNVKKWKSSWTNFGYNSLEDMLDEAMNLATANAYETYEITLLKVGSKWYKKKADYAKAYSYQERYIVLQEKLFDREKLGELVKLKAQFDLTQKEKELEYQKKRVLEEQTSNAQLKELNTAINSQQEQLKSINLRLGREIEERKKIEKELIMRNEELQQFAYITAHNLREPIANITGLLQLYNKDNPTDDFNATVIENLSKASYNIDGLVKDLYQIVAAKSGIDEKIIEINLPDFVEKIKQSIAHKIEETNAIIETDFSKVETIFTVKSYLENIFYNLITNSIKYRFKGRNPHIKISTYGSPNDLIGIVFQDNGMGIDLQKNQDKLFGLFSRFHNHVKGTGLGLYLVKSQVDALGGSIGVASKVGEGTIFRLMFNQGFSSDHTGK